jgi:nitrous oxide reductase accessory protein NosL
MKKILVVVALVSATLVGCQKEESFVPDVQVSEDLKISQSTGIKLQTPFVTNEVAMNVKTEKAGTFTVKILNIANRVVSKETVDVKSGDNVLKVYTSALPSSAYRIALFDDKGVQIGITDFNKL